MQIEKSIQVGGQCEASAARRLHRDPVAQIGIDFVCKNVRFKP